jgi:hypothetical protein
MEKLQSSTRKEIRNLLIVIFSGAICAFLLAGALLYTYGLEFIKKQ